MKKTSLKVKKEKLKAGAFFFAKSFFFIRSDYGKFGL
jgi:hypothetical protein